MSGITLSGFVLLQRVRRVGPVHHLLRWLVEEQFARVVLAALCIFKQVSAALKLRVRTRAVDLVDEAELDHGASALSPFLISYHFKLREMRFSALIFEKLRLASPLSFIC